MQSMEKSPSQHPTTTNVLCSIHDAQSEAEAWLSMITLQHNSTTTT